MTSRTNLNLACLQRFALLILILVTSPMLAQQTHVVTNLNDTGAGSLRETIVNSSFGDTITFSPSLLTSGNAVINLASPISFQHSLTIKGLFTGSDSLIISGMNTNRVFYVEASNNLIPTKLHLQDLIIKNGRHTSSDHLLDYTNGGACYISGLDKLSLENVIMRDNHAKGEAKGGAMFLNNNDTVVIKQCEFNNNNTDTTSTSGSLGGAIVQRYGILMVDDCRFVFNHSRGLGGALRKYAGTLIIEDSKFIANKTQHSWGGAVYTFNTDSVLISQSFFSKNKAKRQGGAIYLSRSGATIYNSSFIKNEAEDGGGGAVSCSPHPDYKKIDIIDCTLDSNWAYEGGAMNLQSGNYLVKGCLVHNNVATQRGGGAIRGQNSELMVASSTLKNNQGNHGSALELLHGSKALMVNTTVLGHSGSDLFDFTTWDSLKLKSSIFVVDGGDIQAFNTPDGITSLGHNIFSGSHFFLVSTDQFNITPQTINLKPLGYYGGNTLCQPPMPGSPALNAGNPNDFSPAQNGPVFGIRDCGAAEASVSSADTAELCGIYQWRGMTFSTPGVYTDTVFNTNSLDSIVYLHLQKPDSLLRIVNGKLVAPPRPGNTSYQWISCDTPSTTITGATDSLFQPTANGTYAVVMTRPNCTDTSECMSYNQVDIQEHEIQTSFVSFYPNPSKGFIHVEVNENTELKALLIFDLQGRSVAQHKVSGHIINLGNLPSGVFILEWHSGKGEVQRDQLVIE